MVYLIKRLTILLYDTHTNRLIADNDKKISRHIDRNTKKLLRIFRIIEIIPAIAGFALSMNLKQIFFRYDYLLAGFILTIILSLIFESHFPGPPIGLKKDKRKISSY